MPGRLELMLRNDTLPFVGRTEERAAILELLAMERQEPLPRAVLIEGDAGSGKSRLLQQLRIDAEYAHAGAAVVRLRAAASPMLGTGLRQLLRSIDPEQGRDSRLDAPGCFAALARLASNRPLLIMLDNANLLNHMEAIQLASCLKELPESMLIVVLAGDTRLLMLQGLLHSCLCRTFQLERLADDDVLRLLEKVIGTEYAGEVARALPAIGRGLPWLLRSQLNLMLHEGWLSEETQPPRLCISREALTEGLKLALDRELELRLSGLKQQDRLKMETLACCGRHFGWGALRYLLEKGADDFAGRMLDEGRFVQAAVVPLRISGPPETRIPLCFRDTFLQVGLSGRASPPDLAFLDLLSGYAALHDPAAFLNLERVEVGQLTLDLRLKLLEACTRLLGRNERQPALHLHCRIGDAALALAESNDEGHWSRHRPIRLACVRLLEAYLFLIKSRAGQPDFLALAERMCDITRDRRDRPFPEYHLKALVQLNRHHLRLGSEHLSIIRSDIDSLTTRHPKLRQSRVWLVYLGDLGLMAWGRTRFDELEWLADRFAELCALNDDKFVESAENRIGPSLLSVMETRQDRDASEALLARLSARLHPDDAAFAAFRQHYLLESCQIEAMLRARPGALELWKRRQLDRNLRVEQGWHLAALALCGEGLDWLEAMSMGPDQERRELPLPLLKAALLLQEFECFERIRSGLRPPSSDVRHLYDLVSLLGRTEKWTPDLDAHIRSLDPQCVRAWPPRVRELVRLLETSPGQWSTHPSSRLMRLLRKPLLTQTHLVVLHVILRMWRPGMKLHPAAEQAVEEGMAWLEACKLGPVMGRWCGSLAGRMDPARLRDWRQRAEWAGIGLPDRLAVSGDISPSRVQIRLIGSITFSLPGEERWTAMKGARQKTLLCLLTADLLLRKPLKRSEFAAIFMGAAPEDDAAISRTRLRNLLGISVHRLRRLLGPDAIRTGGALPELNTERLQIDLLECMRHLDDCELELKEGKLLKARESLLKHLTYQEKGLLFPGQYASFFETLRDDIESRARRFVLDCARRLEVESEQISAEELLRQAFEHHPDDEDVATALRQLLIAGDRRTEADRIKARYQRAMND